MKTSVLIFLCAVVAASLAAGFVPSTDQTSIALAVKVINAVSHKTVTSDWMPAKKGEILFSGDEIRTGDRSIAIVKFKDNSMLRVREASELKLFGESKDGIFNKTVDVTRGEFSFDIEKQNANEKFTFSSPTSVAAIRGTRGTFESSHENDLVVVVDGLVNLLNSISHKTVEIAAGHTGVSNPDGSITVRESTKDELSHAHHAIDSARNTGPEKSIDLEIKDGQGNKKKLHIRYHD